MQSSPLITDLDGYTRAKWVVARSVDFDKRFPCAPFRFEGVDTWCEHERFRGGGFGRFLRALATQYGDGEVCGMSIDPPSAYYREYYGSYAAFQLTRADVADRYGAALVARPNGDPAGTLFATSDVFCVAGSSGSWAVWGERWLSLAVVHTAGVDMSWRGDSDWFVSTDEAISWFVEPNWRDGILPDGMRQALHANFNSLDLPGA